MAVSAVPAYLQNGSHSATLFRQASSSVVPNAGGLVQAGDLTVTQTGTASMAVVVGVGRAWVPGTNVANFSGFTYSSQAQYFALNDGPVTLTVAAADPTNPRVDVVCLTVNDSQYSGSTNNAVLQVVTGTPAASPSAPATPANSLVLATVSVAANSTSIVNANITQVAVPYNWLHAQYTSSVTPGAGSSWGVGTTFTTVAAKTFNNTFSSATAVGGSAAINFIEPGEYSIHMRLYASVDSGYWYGAIKSSDNSITYADNFEAGGTGHPWAVTVSIPNILITAANTVILPGQTVQNSIATNCVIDVKKHR